MKTVRTQQATMPADVPREELFVATESWREHVAAIPPPATPAA